MGFLLCAAECIASHTISDYCSNLVGIIPTFFLWLIRLSLEIESHFTGFSFICWVISGQSWMLHCRDSGFCCVSEEYWYFSLGKRLTWFNSKLCLGYYQLRCQFGLFFLWGCLMHVGFKNQLDTWAEFIQNLQLLLLGFLYSWIPSSVPNSCGWPEICLLAVEAEWLFVLEFYLLLSANCCLGQSCIMVTCFFQVSACASSRICLFCLLASAFIQTKQN